MMACRYANIEKYLHGISFKGGSHMPWRQGLLARFAIWPAYLKQAGGRPEPRIERPIKKQIQVMAAEIYRWRWSDRSRATSVSGKR